MPSKARRGFLASHGEAWMEACMKSDDKELIAQMTRALIFPESMGLLEGGFLEASSRLSHFWGSPGHMRSARVRRPLAST